MKRSVILNVFLQFFLCTTNFSVSVSVDLPYLERLEFASTGIQFASSLVDWVLICHCLTGFRLAGLVTGWSLALSLSLSLVKRFRLLSGCGGDEDAGD
jgi:hypothetical protein